MNVELGFGYKIRGDNSKTSYVNLLLRIIFHCVCLFVWSGVLLWGLFIWISITEKQQEQPVIRFLKRMTPGFYTNWNYVFQTIFLGLSLSHDVLEWMNKHDNFLGSKIRYWKDIIFNGMVVPYTLFVTSMFWCIYAIDRELVFPKIYDEVVPWWFNQCVHTNITIMVIIETILQARRRPTDERMETILHSIVAISYAVLYYSIYYFTRRWLYQVFGIMTWWQVCLFQLLIWSSCYVFYRIHFPLNRLIHGSEDLKDEKKIIEVKEENENVVNNSANAVNPNGADGISGNDHSGKNVMDLKTPPFSTDSWSVKHRPARNQFEKSVL